MSAAFFTGRCAPMPSSERAATRLCHSDPSLGRMMSRPANAAALATAPNSPAATPAGAYRGGRPRSEPSRSSTPTANRCKRRLAWAILVPASPSTSGFWAIAPRSLVSVAAISTTCSPRKGSPDEDLRLVDVWIGDRPVDDGPVVPPGSAPMHRVKVAQREQAHGERTARDGLLYS